MAPTIDHGRIPLVKKGIDKKKAARRAALLLLPLALGALGIACPTRDLTIQITETGVATLLTSCRGFEKACSTPGSCADDPQLCEFVGGECVLRNRCHLGSAGHAAWSSATKKEARLVLFSIDGAKLGDASACITFDPAKCLGDRSCFANEINAQLNELMKDGLTFDGFVDEEDALLAFAIFEASDQGEAPCDPSRLVACGGLAPPLGGGDYDMTCASCQDSSGFALGHNNGPCPSSRDECFLERCERMLRDSK